jgi:5-dehydro-2-deoxygluconokinase
MGRSGMDLCSNNVGVDFVHIKSFAAYVGGSPTDMECRAAQAGIEIGAAVMLIVLPVSVFALFVRRTIV